MTNIKRLAEEAIERIESMSVEQLEEVFKRYGYLPKRLMVGLPHEEAKALYEDFRGFNDWSTPLNDETSDEFLVCIISKLMHEKLTKKRGEGYGGWNTGMCSIDRLKEMLDEHVKKGDMIDVINLAAMIHIKNIQENK